MSSRQERRRRQRLLQQGNATAVMQHDKSIGLWKWFWRQSRAKKIPVLALVVGILGLFSLWLVNAGPAVLRWIMPKPDIQIGVAFYAYERGWTVEGKTMQTLAELRNLPSNCYLWQIPERPLPKDAKVVDPHSLVLSKFRFENKSDERITNLRAGIASPLLNKATQVSATPNVEAKGRLEATHNDALHTFIINIDAIQPRGAAILSLETPIDDILQRFLYGEHGKVSVPVVSVSADQFWKLNPEVIRINAMTMFKMETEMRTGDKGISMAEKMEVKVLGPSDPEPIDESNKLLPKSTHCKVGTAGNW
jgi:hypothetical protein